MFSCKHNTYVVQAHYRQKNKRVVWTNGTKLIGFHEFGFNRAPGTDVSLTCVGGAAIIATAESEIRKNGIGPVETSIKQGTIPGGCTVVIEKPDDYCYSLTSMKEASGSQGCVYLILTYTSQA